MKKINTTKGITLIALVITIIVLLILAAVSIATLTGENGILTKARTAKDATDEATAREKVQVAVLGSFDKDGKLDLKQLKENLEKEGITDFVENEDSSLTVNVDGYVITVTKDGEVSVATKGTTPNVPSTVTEAKEQMYTFNRNTQIQDGYGNKVKIPEGFKIVSDSAENVTGGIVIEDVSHGATAGSQFVWIPIGEIYTAQEHTEANKKTITLERYDFAEDGTPTAYSGSYKEENIKDTANLLNYGNTIAKDIEAFKTSVTNNGGYYIGRYEARRGVGEQATVKGSEKVYNMVSQQDAADLSQKMYSTKPFVSDLMNGYAWDTAILFIQAFGQSNYARQKSLNSASDTDTDVPNTFSPTGTNNLTDKALRDQQCNIWDMASNTAEWSTETASDSSTPFVYRGGDCWSSGYVSRRFNYYNAAYAYFSFRPILYF